VLLRLGLKSRVDRDGAEVIQVVALGKVRVPSTVSNLTFGGRRRSRLFICASQALFAVYTNQRGAQRP
jgi:sugar lactone lactonase YvrE